MKHLSWFLIVISLVSCKQLCKLDTWVADSFAKTITTQCVCSSPAQIKSDLEQLFNVPKVCNASSPSTQKPGGVLGSIVCDAAGTILAYEIAQHAFPDSWGCSNKFSCVDKVISVAELACSMIVPF
jgi:hypothetical protein